MLRKGITARDIMTMEAFENAITVVMALGGSTNAVLHLLAIAREAGVGLTLADFNRVGDKVPHLGDLKPFGRYVMNDVDKVGGIPVVMKALLDAGLMHGDVMTVTGATMAENLAHIELGLDGDVIRRARRPIHRTRRPHDPARLARTRRRRGEERRFRFRRLPRHRSGVRRGTQRDERPRRRHDRGR